MKTIAEPFTAHRELGFGVPTLRAWQHKKTMHIEWSDWDLSSMDAAAFKTAVDHVAMNAELREIWQRCKSQCGRNASVTRGGVSGWARYIPHAAGFEIMAAVRKHFNAGLEELVRRALLAKDLPELDQRQEVMLGVSPEVFLRDGVEK